MKQKIFLTSAIALGVTYPAMAVPTNTGTFPNDGYMQEDYTYTNAATADNMDSVYEGSVNAIAEYTEIPYSAAEGFYLTGVDDNNNATTAECTSGNFCPGVQSTTYENNAFGNTGLQSCSTATSGAYTLSDAGASSSDQCYRTCSGNITLSHATGVSGNDYYDGTNTCEPTGCENGWHVKPRLNLTSTIGTSEGATIRAYIDNKGRFIEEGASHGQSYYGITDNNTWAVDYGSSKGMLVGQVRCSTTPGTINWGHGITTTTFSTETNIADETGQEGAQYCYCNVTGYKDGNGNLQSLSSVWVFGVDLDSASYCARDCSYRCSNYMRSDDSDYLVLRAEVLDSVTGFQSEPASCEANVININWYNADANDISANNAGTATYGSDVRTPVKAQTIKGKTFKGWRFSKPEQTDLP